MQQRTFRGLRSTIRASIVCFALSSCAVVSAADRGPLVVEEQGSFAAGGTVTTAPGAFDPHAPLEPAGQSYHGDHAYAFYQIPVNARKYPIVMWHGAGQFSKTWETTADGREGFQTIFLRRRFGVYLVDQPRRGDAGRGMVGTTIKPTPDEQLWFNQFRIGLWPNCFAHVQFSCDSDTLNQFYRAMTPNTGPFDMNVVSDGVASVFKKIGPGILFTHSQGGGPGWLTAIKNANVKAIGGVRAGQQFCLPGKRSTSRDTECVRYGRGYGGSSDPVLGADKDSHLGHLRRQHSRSSSRPARSG
nr:MULTISPECIES: alpha/beta fold hydrolase [unclassified Caballeronia]